jgi:hypothetical protein
LLEKIKVSFIIAFIKIFNPVTKSNFTILYVFFFGGGGVQNTIYVTVGNNFLIFKKKTFKLNITA